MFDALKKKYDQLLNPINQGLSQAARSIPQPVKSFVKPIVNEVRNIATQQIPSYQRVIPLTQMTNNPIGFMDAAKQQIQNLQRNKPMQAAKNVGMDVYNSAKLGANVYGGSKILGGGLLSAAKTVLPNAAIGGAFNKAMGGSFSEGAGQGVAISPSIRGVTGVTNPLIERYTQLLAPKLAPTLTKNPIGNYLATSAIRGVQNVPEGALIDASLGRRPLSAGSVALDFASGFLPGSPNARGKLNVNANAKQVPMSVKDRDFVTKKLAEILDNKENADYQIRFRDKVEEDIRQIAEGYTNKEFAWKQPFEVVAQEIFNRAKVDGGDKQFSLPSMGLVEGGEFKLPYKAGDIKKLEQGLKDELSTLSRTDPKQSRIQELEYYAKQGNEEAQAQLDLVRSMEENIARAKEAKNTPIKVKPNVAQERVTDTGKYYIRNGLNELVKAENAKPINLGNNVEAFSHRFGKDTSVVISEAKTGMQIATGKTEKEAIANAQKAFKDLRGITPQQLIERQLKSLESGIIKGTDGGIGRRNVGSLNTGQEAIPYKETYRFGSRPTMRGANPSSVNNSRLSQARPELDQLSGDGALPLSGSKTQLVRVGESNPKLTGVPSSEMSPDLLSRKIIPQSPQKSFTQPGSATNTRADQIAPKFRKPAPFEVEMDAQAGKPYEKPFTGKSKMKFKEPTTLPGDQATTDFATGRMAMGGNGVKGLPKNISDSFQQWVNTRRATQLEGVLKKKEFSDLNNKGIEGIFEFQSGNKTGRYGDVKKYFDAKYKTLQDNKIQFDFRQDYLPQLWANTPEEVSQVLGRRMGMKPSFTLDAVFKSYKEGIEAGLTPKFKNISDLTGWYEQKANKAIADKNFFDYLGKDGSILPSTKAPQDWVTLDPDRFPKFLTEIGDEKFAGTYKAPKGLADVVNGYLREPAGGLEKLANYVSGVKSIALNFGIPGTAINAHGVNILARHTLMGSGGNPISRFLTGTKYMFNQKASGAELDKVITRAPKAMKDGLMLSSDDYSNRIVEATGLKQKFGKKWEEVFGGPLFNKMLPALKISSYEELVKNGMDGKDAAKLVNNVYGGINWEQMGRSKDTQNLLRIAILAPDWAETTLRTGGNFAKAFNPKDRSMVMNRYRTMMATILGSYVAHNVVNKITSGHYSYENEPSNIFNIQIGYTEDGEKRYVRPYGTGLDMVRLPAEVAMGLFKGDLTGVTRLVRNRLSIPAGVVTGMLTDQDYRGNAIGYRGTDRFGNQMPVGQRAMNIGTEMASLVGLPSFVKQLGMSATGQQSLEAGLTQGFELPTRYQNPGKSKTQEYIGEASGLKGKDLYDIKTRFKGESPFSDNQKALINQGGMNTLNEIMQLRDQKRQVNKSKDIQEKVVNGEMTEEEGQKALEEILKTSAPAAKAAPSGVSKADAAGLQFTSSSDGDVQQSNTSSDLGEEIAKNRVKISKKSERMGDKIIYPTEKGSATLDLSAPSKGNGIAAFSNKDWNITKAREVHNNDALSKEDKDYAFKKLGVKQEDVRYDALANYSNDIKSQYLISKSDTKEKLIENILTGRKMSIGDNIFASNGVIDAMVDAGKLTKEEAKYLKTIDYNKDGTLKQGTGTGKKGRKPTLPKSKVIKISFPKAKKVKRVKTAKVTQVKQYKLKKVKRLSGGIKKVSRLS